MKARKIDISNYELPYITAPDGTHPMYQCRNSMAELCFVPELHLNGSALMRAQRVAQSILDEPTDAVLLGAEEFLHIQRAADLHEGFSRNDVELVRRIRESETVEVHEGKDMLAAMDCPDNPQSKTGTPNESADTPDA